MYPIDTTNIIQIQNDHERIIVSINRINLPTHKTNEQCMCTNNKASICDQKNPRQKEYNKLVKEIYSKAVPVEIWADYTKCFIKSAIGICADDIIYSQGICSDDVDAPRHGHNIGQFPKSADTFLGPFMSGGLAGYPFVGKLGLKACASHVTKTGTLFISSMSHIGITKDGIVGKINRLGSSEPSDTCGAVKASLDWVMNHSEPPDLDRFVEEGDYEFYKIIKILWAKRCELLRLPNLADRMLRATEIMRDASKKYIKEKLPDAVRDYVNKPVIMCSGIFINTDYDYEALVEINYFAIYYPVCGSWEDKTEEYMKGLI